MKRKLICSKCGHKTYVIGLEVPMMLMDQTSICWDCDPKTEKNDLIDILSTVEINDGRRSTKGTTNSARSGRN